MTAVVDMKVFMNTWRKKEMINLQVPLELHIGRRKLRSILKTTTPHLQRRLKM